MPRLPSAETVLSFSLALSGVTAYSLIFGILALCGLGLPIPEDITILAAGFLAGYGNISLWGAILVCFVGVMFGDCFLFILGRIYGRTVFTWPVFRKVFTPRRIAKAEKKIQESAWLICFTARFAPGLRAPTYLTCGILKVPLYTFLILDGFAALISVPLIAWLGYRFHKEIHKALDLIANAKIYLVGFVAIVTLYVIFTIYFSRKK